MNDPKSILTSRTFWANLLGPVFLWLSVRYGLNLDADMQSVIIFAIMSLVNIVLRRVSTEPVAFTLPTKRRKIDD